MLIAQVGAKTVTFLLTVLVTTKLIVLFDITSGPNPLKNALRDIVDSPVPPTKIEGRKFFRVEMFHNPLEKPYFETSHLETYRCSEEKRELFPPDFQALLQTAFTPKLTTNMNMIVMGDSLGVQLSVLFQGVAADHLTSDNRVVLAKYPKDVGDREIYALSQARGGGTIAEWRLFGLLSRFGLEAALPPHEGGGWRLEMVETMKNHSWNRTDLNESPSGQSTVGSFDIMLFRIPQVWITLDAVHFESLLETVTLAAEVFGVKTIVLINLPLVKAYKRTTDLALANERIRSFVNICQERRSSLPATVMLMELGTLITEAGEYNARSLGYDTSNPYFVFEQVPNDPLLYTRPVATNCLSQPQYDEASGSYVGMCPLNMLFHDGLHLCIETFGPRIVGGMACLVECAERDPSHHHECELGCNQRYMRLNGTILEETLA